MAGYSGTPLHTKLGIKPGHRLLLEGAVPDGFLGSDLVLPDDVEVVTKGPVDVALVFVLSRAALEKQWPKVTKALVANGGFWVAWPKKKPASGVPIPTDMTEDVVREVALPQGLVDNKVCAVNDVWSGLRL